MVCSLAKFLALGLIASEGHGPVAVEAITETVYKQIVGKDSSISGTTSTAGTQRELKACKHLYSSYKDLLTPASPTDGLGINGLVVQGGAVTTCNNTAFGLLQTKMLAEWKKDALALGLTIAKDATIAGTTKNVKELLLAELQARYKKLADSNTGVAVTGADEYNKRIKAVKKAIWPWRTAEYKKLAVADYKVTNIDEAKPLTPQIVTLKSATADVQSDLARAWQEAKQRAKNAQSIVDQVQTSNMTLQEQAKNLWWAAADMPANQPTTLPAAQALLVEAKSAEEGAKQISDQVKEEKEKLDVGLGFLIGGILAAVGTVIALLLPCVGYDWKNAAFETDGAKYDWQNAPFNGGLQPYQHRNQANEALNKAFGLRIPAETGPKQVAAKPAAKSSASAALTVVPAGALVVGICLVARRRGLKKRRAQKAAKVSTTAPGHEDV